MNIEERVGQIEARNARVEAEKAWEVSPARIGFIVALTYVVAGLVLYAIGNENPLRNALIPTLGYFLSTQSLPFLKRSFIDRYTSRNKA